MNKVEAQGYDRSAIEMFHEELVDLFVYMAGTETQSASLDGLHKLLTEENATSEYCTWYLRVVTAAYLKADADRFVHFLDGDYFDIGTFCSREVEPMNKECGMVQVLALAEAMGVDVTIEYLDGREFHKNGGLARHEFGPRSMGQEDAGTSITLLYRPGHYDILY
jgi:ubiquitin thioesterase protein OTUB1